MQLAYKFGNSSLEIVSGSVGVVFSVFDNFFIDINRLHNYNTRHAAKQSYYTPEVRTNFGKFIYQVSRSNSLELIPNFIVQ
jgi:hypothetical protein